MRKKQQCSMTRVEEVRSCTRGPTSKVSAGANQTETSDLMADLAHSSHPEVWRMAAIHGAKSVLWRRSRLSARSETGESRMWAGLFHRPNCEG
jgi:hypothetical protein